MPGSGAENFVVSANIEAMKPLTTSTLSHGHGHGHGHGHDAVHSVTQVFEDNMTQGHHSGITLDPPTIEVENGCGSKKGCGPAA